MAENMQISIYHIDGRSVEEEIKNRVVDDIEEFEGKKYTTEEIVEFLLNENKDYSIQTLKKDSEIDVKSYKTIIAYRPSRPKPTTWRDFFAKILDINSNMLKSTKQEESFMAFIYNDKNIYSITGGFAFHRIESYLDSLFGIKILSGLIDKNSKKIKGVSERSVSKSVMATTKMFRVDYSISEDEEFGKIYKEIIAQLDSNILEEKLGFKKDEIKKVQCIARTYFKITKSISIQDVYKFIDKIDKIMEKDINDLNKVNILNSRNKRDKYTIDDLENLLIDKLYNDYIGQEDLYYDICDNDYQSFLLAGNYFLKYNSTVEILEGLEKENIIKAMNSLSIIKKIDLTDRQEFEKFIKNIKIVSFEEDIENESTNSKFLKSLSLELEKENDKYFLMEGTWFKITEDYVLELDKKLNESIKGKINCKLITNTWNKKCIIDEKTHEQKEVYKTETEFMKDNFLQDNTTIISHTKLIDNIEFSDLIKIDENNKKIYLIHIKRGFDASVRDLSYQMMFSYNILQNARLQGKYEKIEKLYEELNENEKNKISKNDFIEIFKKYDFVYVFTFDDETAKNRNIANDLEKFESNIAKGVLLDLIKFFNIENVEFEVAQIKVEK